MRRCENAERERGDHVHDVETGQGHLAGVQKLFIPKNNQKMN